jgi:hypothetical protein
MNRWPAGRPQSHRSPLTPRAVGRWLLTANHDTSLASCHYAISSPLEHLYVQAVAGFARLLQEGQPPVAPLQPSTSTNVMSPSC